MDEDTLIEGENNKELAPALVAVHPLEKYVVVTVGSKLRVFDLGSQCSISLSDNTRGPFHSDAIRAINFDAKGRFFASAGDDKLVKIWMTDSWQCVRTVCSEKRVSAVAINHNGLYVMFADKFGVVWVVGLDEDDDSQALVDKKAIPILGHYCSIITSLEFSPDGRFIATADRDFKIRITKFPRRPLKGAHEIQSFCLGHTDFVSCLVFVSSPDYPVGFLLSGSGDATVCLWDYISGCLLYSCDVGLKAGLVVTNEEEKDSCPAVTDIKSFPNGSLVAVAIQSLNGVILLKCELSTRSLSVGKVEKASINFPCHVAEVEGLLFATFKVEKLLPVEDSRGFFDDSSKVVSFDDSFVPTRIALSSSAGLLWMVMGASNLPNTASNHLLACLKVIAGLEKCLLDTNGHDPVVLDESDIPGGESLLAALQGSLDVSKEEGILTATAAASKTAMHNLLIKKQYSVEKRELRKKSRNDRKQKQ